MERLESEPQAAGPDGGVTSGPTRAGTCLKLCCAPSSRNKQLHLALARARQRVHTGHATRNSKVSRKVIPVEFRDVQRKQTGRQ
ncbi:hypothetical protein CRENBAI_002417 [Crenichthys baileyi]|uniref:Uncharacterized protein n=1 Tax=Crenichthys baileyi TaxID=28760 RepID=A0AAV9RAG1_9TELE